MKTRLSKWGNSLAVRIPKSVVERARVREGQRLTVESDRGRIVLRPESRLRLPDLVSKMTPQNRHAEADWGGRAGEEIW